MPKKQRQDTPPIADNPAHAQVVALFSRLRQGEIESFFARVTGSHGAAVFLREVLYWFMPHKQRPGFPRTGIWRAERYWFCRARQEWQDKHSFSRYKLETIYRRCEVLLEVEHFMFAAQRRTHYSLRFEKLRELLEQDEPLRDKLVSGSPLDVRPEGDGKHPAEGSEIPLPVGGSYPRPSVDSQGSVVSRINHTERGHVVAPSTEPAAQSAPRLASVQSVEADLEEIENPPEVSNQQVQVILKAVEGQTLRQKAEAWNRFTGHSRLFLGYLLIWQAAFEQEHPGRKHPFNDEHLRQARALADQEVGLKPFLDVLQAAWEVRGVSEGHDPLFMCRNHSRRFGQFCKHFTRMESELAQEDLL